MSSLLKKREILIEETIVFLNTLALEIEYSKVNMVEIINKLSNESSMKNLTFLFVCRTNLEKGYDFPQAWSCSLISSPLYKREERNKLLQLGSFLGTSDASNQINTIKIYSSFFEKYLSTASADYEKYGKVSTLFGIFLGAAVFILLF